MSSTIIEKLLQGAEVEWKPLEEVATTYSGLTGKNKTDFENGNAKYVTYKNIFNNIDIDFNTLEHVHVLPHEKQNAIKYGDVLFTGSSETADESGMSSAVITNLENKKVYLNSFSFGLRFNEDIKMRPEFSKYLFRSNFMRSHIAKTASGVTRHNISKSRFLKISIPIPPLSVQEEIVQILDAFTGYTAELTAELTQRQKQYNYYRDKLLTFKDGDAEWKTLGEVAENLDFMRKPIAGGLRKSGEVPYYGASGIVDYVQDYIFDGDFLLVSEDGANLLARKTPIAFSIQGKSWVNNHAHVLKFNSYSERRFIEIYLNSIDLNPYISGAAQPKLNQQNLNLIKVPNPPLAEQQRIVDILDKFDAMTTSITQGLPREIELRQKQYEYYREQLLNFPKPQATI